MAIGTSGSSTHENGACGLLGLLKIGAQARADRAGALAELSSLGCTMASRLAHGSLIESDQNGHLF